MADADYYKTLRKKRMAAGEFILKMKNKDLFETVKRMDLPLGKYVLFGSAPLGIRGLKQCHDIDILITEDLWKEYSDKEGWELVKLSNGHQCLRHHEIELWKDWWPGEWNTQTLIQGAETITGLPFVNLSEVLKWKELFNREKDAGDIDLIETFLHQHAEARNL